jgi:Methyltransferase domain
MAMANARPGYWREATLTHAMADTRRADWEHVLAPYRSKVRSVLEVGCYEGQSALFWLNFFDCERIVCVDNWANFADGTACPYEVENHFDANLRPWHERLNKIKSESTVALHSLRGFEFDFIYIDGDHSEDQVMVDSCLAWPLLRPGGVMVWDDFIDQGGGLSVERAVRKFLELHPHRVLHEGGQQMMVEKVTSPSRQKPSFWQRLTSLHNVFENPAPPRTRRRGLQGCTSFGCNAATSRTEKIDADRGRLETRPNLTGSSPMPITIGVAVVAALAARRSEVAGNNHQRAPLPFAPEPGVPTRRQQPRPERKRWPTWPHRYSARYLRLLRLSPRCGVGRNSCS